MNTANDTNAKHSVAIAAIAGEFVVSCFPIVAGETDTDNEIFVQTFTDAAIARRFYASKSALLACKAAAFDAEIDWVWGARSSLASCLCREVPNESRRLRAAMADLELSTLVRSNAERETRKANALRAAAETLAARNEGLEAKIQDEAARRVCLGQP
jgi:hypothetical protein